MGLPVSIARSGRAGLLEPPRRPAAARFSSASLLVTLLLGGCSLEGLIFDLPPEGPGGACGEVIDRNDDGLLDCADLVCSQAGHRCAAIPPGWSGPGLVHVGATASLPSCPEAFPVREAALSELHADPASCVPCACSAPQRSCQGQGWSAFGDEDCTTPVPASHEGISGGSCGSVSADGVKGIIVRVPQVEVDGCEPSGGEATLTQPVWGDPVLLCGAGPITTCTASGAVCLPPSPAPFQAGVCIWQPGTRDCPADFTERHLLGSGPVLDDTRSCSPCTCPQAFTCGPVYNYYADGNCQELILNVDVFATCAPNDGIGSVRSYNLTSRPIEGSCPPTGGEPQGDVLSADALTVCCQP
ncbi:hypothetical protein [Chondromyces crocatus]|uniref:Uncharacterized protein n=1 Tax=Chondromyces crocatus TaxID=52 RepID=A0A0K1EGY2_CHOCO|nr:hypothetical protein [Chondromyces crocatus]AKT40115.1 uncharacterized protein CMC5_042680 [Chondromyces crocatus]